MSDQVPDVEVTPVRRSLWSRVSIVWLVPIAALVVAVGIAWQSYYDRGPLIEVYFDDAAGVSANETELRYRDVTVGLVENVAFTDELDRVVVSIRLDKQVADFVDEDATFWVVRPQVTTQGVTGLDTVLSGVYIAGQWNIDPQGLAGPFVGLRQPPLLTGDQQGLQILLRSSGGTLSGDVPLLYKGVEVGRVGSAQVSPDGYTVEAQAVVYAPYDNLVTTTTRFWDDSGFSFSFGTGGAEINFASLASLIAGGLTFDTFISGAPLAEDGDSFDVYYDDSAARASVFNAPDGNTLTMAAIFEGNAAGLVAGSVVELDGLRIGAVSGLNGVVDERLFGDRNVRLQVVFDIQPERLGFEGDGADQLALAFFDEQVADGLRARLATGNLLTGGLKVQLIKPEDTPPATLEPGLDNYPTIPTTANDITDVAATAESTLARIDALPIEELMQSAVSFLDNAATLVGSDAVRQTPDELRGLLADIRGITASDDLQALPGQIAAVMTELQASVARVSGILEQVETQDTVGRVLAAVDGVAAVTDEVRASLQGVPALIAQVEAVAAKAEGLPLEDLMAQVTDLAASAGALIGSDATQALPGRAETLLASLDTAAGAARDLLVSVDEAGGAERLLAAIDAAGQAAATLDRSLEGVPALIDSITSVAETADGLPLEALLTQVTGLAEQAQGLVGSASSLVASQDLQALPASLTALTRDLSSAVTQARVLIGSVNEAGGAERLLAAVDSAGAAAATLDTSLAGVPALIDSITAVSDRAASLPLEDLLAEVTGLAGQAQDLVGAATGLVTSQGVQALPAQLSALSNDLSSTVTQVRTLVTSVNDGDGAARLLAAVDAAGAAAQSLDASLTGVPALVERIDALAATAGALPLDELISRASAVLQSADGLIASPAAQALPAELSSLSAQLRGTLNEAQSLIADLNEGGAAEALLAAIDNANSAIASVDRSIAGVPGLVARLDSLAAQAETLPVEALMAQLTEVADAAGAILQSDTTRALPGSLNGALDQLRMVILELREGGTVENANATLASARSAADQIAAAADTLPGLVARASALLDQANGTLGGFQDTSPAIRDARSALREVQQAAEAVSSLARALERRPNSLLIGR